MNSAIKEHESYVYSSDKMTVAVEDEWGIWPSVRQIFESRVPLQSVKLSNKSEEIIELEKLPLQYVLTSDATLRNRPAAKNSPHWFLHPYATMVLLNCEDLEDYRLNVRPKLQRLIQGEWREWLIVHVMRSPANDSTGRIARRVYARIEDHFRKDRCCKLELSSLESEGWADMEKKLVECIRTTLSVRMHQYEDEVKRLWNSRASEQSNVSGFFVEHVGSVEPKPSALLSYFLIKESLAFMMDMAQLKNDALKEYEEIDSSFVEAARDIASAEFGGNDAGDAVAAVFDIRRKPFSSFVCLDGIRAFDFRQYIFARQTSLLFEMGRVGDVAQKASSFIFAFSRELSKVEASLPVCLKEVWVYTACLSVASLCAERFVSRAMNPADRDFHRVQGLLYSTARKKLMRLGDLVGYASALTPSPCNQAALSLNPWPLMLPPLPVPGAEELSSGTMFQPKQAEGGLPGVTLEQILGPSFHGGPLDRKEHPYYARVVSEMAAGEAPSTLGLMAALHSAIVKMSDADGSLKTALFSFDSFLDKLVELSQLASDSFLRCSWRRHGLSMDAEVANLLRRRGSLSEAARLYERLVQFYSTEKWLSLLSAVLPSLLSCQQALCNLPAQIHAHSKLLTHGSGATQQQREGAQLEIMRLAAALCISPPSDPALKPAPQAQPVPPPLPDSVTLDVSSLLTFSVASRPLPVEMTLGEQGKLSLEVWSDLPLPVALNNLTVQLLALPNFSADTGIMAESSTAVVLLPPGTSLVPLTLKATGPGASLDQSQPHGLYALGSLSACLEVHPAHSSPAAAAGKSADALLVPVRLRSSSAMRRAGLGKDEDFFTQERPIRTVLKVLPPRHSVELNAVVSRGLLLGQTQWVGIRLRPLGPHSSLSGASLHFSLGPSLTLISSRCSLALPALGSLPASASASASEPGSPSLASSASMALSSVGSELSTVSERVAEQVSYVQVELRQAKGQEQSAQVVLPDLPAMSTVLLWLQLQAEQQDELLAGGVLGVPHLPTVLASPSTSFDLDSSASVDGPADSGSSDLADGSPAHASTMRASSKAGTLSADFTSPPRGAAMALHAAAAAVLSSSREKASSTGSLTGRVRGRGAGRAEQLQSQGQGPPNPAGSLHRRNNSGSSAARGKMMSQTSRPSSAAMASGAAGVAGGGEGAEGGELEEDPQASLEGLRLLHLRVSVGSLTHRSVERSIGLHFRKPFVVHTRLVSQSTQGELLLQVSLLSELAAQLTVVEAKLVLQTGLEHSLAAGGSEEGEGRPLGGGLPLCVSPQAQPASLIFAIRVAPRDEAAAGGAAGSSSELGISVATLRPALLSSRAQLDQCLLRLSYSCAGDPRVGAHSPPSVDQLHPQLEQASSGPVCLFEHSFTLQAPVLQRVLAVGMLPLPPLRTPSASALPSSPSMGSLDGGLADGMGSCARLGVLVQLRWLVERLAAGRVGPASSPAEGGGSSSSSSSSEEEIEYEVKHNASQWMLSGRKTGYLSLGLEKGSRAVVSLWCIPTSTGHLHPPLLRLPSVHRSLVTRSPAGPHLVLVLPPQPHHALCSRRLRPPLGLPDSPAVRAVL